MLAADIWSIPNGRVSTVMRKFLVCTASHHLADQSIMLRGHARKMIASPHLPGTAAPYMFEEVRSSSGVGAAICTLLPPLLLPLGCMVPSKMRAKFDELAFARVGDEKFDGERKPKGRKEWQSNGVDWKRKGHDYISHCGRPGHCQDHPPFQSHFHLHFH